MPWFVCAVADSLVFLHGEPVDVRKQDLFRRPHRGPPGQTYPGSRLFLVLERVRFEELIPQMILDARGFLCQLALLPRPPSSPSRLHSAIASVSDL